MILNLFEKLKYLGFKIRKIWLEVIVIAIFAEEWGILPESFRNSAFCDDILKLIYYIEPKYHFQNIQQIYWKVNFIDHEGKKKFAKQNQFETHIQTVHNEKIHSSVKFVKKNS